MWRWFRNLIYFYSCELNYHDQKIRRTILNKSWRQHLTKQQLYGLLPLITKAIKVRRTRHAGHCWRSKDEFICDVLLWTPSNGRAKAGRSARTYIQQFCADTGCIPEDLPEAMMMKMTTLQSSTLSATPRRMLVICTIKRVYDIIFACFIF